MLRMITVFLMSLLLLSMSNCSSIRKYEAPPFEDCTVITSWSNNLQTDVATCFCVDSKLDEKRFEALTRRARNVLQQHPLQESVLDYLESSKSEIIKIKEYELPVSYCRGYSAISPVDRTQLVIWAEDNRMGRIKCEAGY